MERRHWLGRGQLGVVGLGLQLGDQMVQRPALFSSSVASWGSRPASGSLPVRGGRPCQAGAESRAGPVTHVLLAVALEPLIEMTGTSGWVHRRFLRILTAAKSTYLKWGYL